MESPICPFLYGFSHSTWLWDSSMLLQMVVVHVFSLLNNISLCEYTHFVCHSNMWLLGNSAVASLLTVPSGAYMCTVPVGIHLGAELLGHQGCTCLALWCFINFWVSWQHLEFERLSIKSALFSKCKDATMLDPHSTFVSPGFGLPIFPQPLPVYLTSSAWLLEAPWLWDSRW